MPIPPRKAVPSPTGSAAASAGTSHEDIMKANLHQVEVLSFRFLLFCAAVIVLYSFSVALVAPPAAQQVQFDGEFAPAFGTARGFLLGVGSYLAVLTAAVAVGGLLGFLFGIPRLLQRMPQVEPVAASPLSIGNEKLAGPASETGQLSRFAGNTNLEDISDWLTKIIVGLGLTQAHNIYKAFVDAQSQFATSAMGDTAGASAMFAAIVLSGLVAGFLFFYLETRTRLTILLASADHFERNLSPAHKALAYTVHTVEKDALLDKVRITRESPDAGTPTDMDRQIARVPFSELRTVGEFTAWGAAQERIGNAAEAERAFQAALALDGENPKIYLALASVRQRRGESEQAAKVLTDATEKFSDNAAVLKDTLLTALYVPPPTGYTTALAAADQLRRNFPESMDDPQVQLWIAAANGQKFANLKDGPERETARTAALEAVRRVIALSPDPESRVRITLRKIFNPAAEGSNPTENDLEVFKDDPAFQELIKPKPENPQQQDPQPQHPQP